ncbi:V-type proton ATPase subunit G3 [Linum grandiflorum]
MDPMRSQGGIQMLLSAEQEAQQIVAAARNLKLSRLKQAKDEAEKEAVRYRSQLQAEFQKKIAEGNPAATAKQLDEDTMKKIEKLKESSSKVQPELVDLLFKYVTTVKN